MIRFSRCCNVCSAKLSSSPDLATATAAWRESNGAFDFVTQTGELLNRHGIFTGGNVNGNGSGKRRPRFSVAKIRSRNCKSTATQLQEQVNEISRSKGALLSEQTELQASLQQAQTELRTQEVAIATRQGEFNALQNSQARLAPKNRHGGLRNHAASPRRNRKAIKSAKRLAAQIGDFENSERELQAQVTELNATLEQSAPATRHCEHQL